MLVLKTYSKHKFSLRKILNHITNFYVLNIFPLKLEIRKFVYNLLRKIFRRNKVKKEITLLTVSNMKQVIQNSAITLVETDQRDGNITLFELGVICSAVKSLERCKLIIEIGTFDGRTTLNIAVNSPPDAKIITLDLPANEETKYELAPYEQQYVEKKISGERFVNADKELKTFAKKIEQVYGDSATYDWSEFYGKADLVFVDGSHAYDYVVSDTETALKLIRPGGTILWHDYGEWDGVTKALNEFDEKFSLGLKHIKFSTLVILKQPIKEYKD